MGQSGRTCVGRWRVGLALALVLVTALMIPVPASATPVPGTPPTLTGDAFINGSGLVGNNGTWGGPNEGSFDYSAEIFRDEGSAPVAVKPVGQSWQPTSEDVGHTLTCKVKAKDPSDSSSATSAASNGLLIKAAAPAYEPGSTEIVLTPVHGEDRVQCSANFSDPDLEYTYSTDWFLNDVMQSTHAAAFDVPDSAGGQPIKCRMTATNGA